MREANVWSVAIRLFSGLCVILDALYWVSGFSDGFEFAAVVCVFVLSLALCVRARKNSLLFLMSFSIAYSNYSAMIASYSSGYAQRSLYDTMYQGTWVASEGTFVLLLFMGVLVLCLPTNIEEVALDDFFDRYKGIYSLPVVLGLSAVLIVIWLTCSSGFSTASGRGEANQLFEYSYIFFVLGFYFSGRRRGLQGILLAIALLYVLQNVLTGNRAGVLAILMLVYALYIAGRWSMAQIIPALIVGFLVFMVIGDLRENLLVSPGRVPEAVSGLFANWLVWDTASFAYHQGLAFVRLAHDAGVGEIHYLVGQWLAGVFLGGTAAPDSALSLYAQRIYPGMGGGFIPFYFYCYFGAFGVMVTGLAVSMVFRLVGGGVKKELGFRRHDQVVSVCDGVSLVSLLPCAAYTGRVAHVCNWGFAPFCGRAHAIRLRARTLSCLLQGLPT